MEKIRCKRTLSSEQSEVINHKLKSDGRLAECKEDETYNDIKAKKNQRQI